MKKNLWKVFVIAVAIALVVFVVKLEIDVQERWDRYEEKVFIERSIK